MSYKTKAKSLRLGVSHNWSYKSHGSHKNFHFDNKLKNYISNLIEFLVPEAPRRDKKKKTKAAKNALPQPGLQGKSIVIRTTEYTRVIIYHYLNLDTTPEIRLEYFYSNLENIAALLEKETEYKMDLYLLNYFIYFWRMEVFLGVKCPYPLRQKIKKCIKKFDWLQNEQMFYAGRFSQVKKAEKAVARYRKNRFFTRCFYPMMAAFIFSDFDCELAAKLIAKEIQVLRKEHKKFINFIRALINVMLNIFNQEEIRLIQGLQLVINGRMTDYTRQVRRTGTKQIVFRYRKNTMKRSDYTKESGHSSQLAYNRYGSISIHLTYQLTSLKTINQWKNSCIYNFFPHFFNVKDLTEMIFEKNSKLKKIVSNHDKDEQDLFYNKFFTQKFKKNTNKKNNILVKQVYNNSSINKLTKNKINSHTTNFFNSFYNFNKATALKNISKDKYKNPIHVIKYNELKKKK